MSNKLIDNNFFSTTDLSLAVTISLYYPIKSIDKTNPKKVIFIFEKDKDFDLILERYWKKDLKVEPQEYYQNLRMLKNRIYNM